MGPVTLLCFLQLSALYIATTTATVTVTLTFVSAVDVTRGGTPCLRVSVDPCRYKYIYCADTAFLPMGNCITERESTGPGGEIKFVRNKLLKTESGLTLPQRLSFVFQATDRQTSRTSNNDLGVRRPTTTGSWQFTRLVDLPTGTVPLPKENIDRTFKVTWAYTVTCDVNFFTKKCDVYCVPQDDDVNGHYTCNDTDGEKICNYGYVGPECKIYDKCLVEGIYCGSNGECCVAVYTNEAKCCCHDGYTGDRCDVNCYGCATNPCGKGKTCVVGPTGNLCQITEETTEDNGDGGNGKHPKKFHGSSSDESSNGGDGTGSSNDGTGSSDDGTDSGDSSSSSGSRKRRKTHRIVRIDSHNVDPV